MHVYSIFKRNQLYTTQFPYFISLRTSTKQRYIMRIVRTNIVSNIDDGNRRQRFRRIYRCVKDLLSLSSKPRSKPWLFTDYTHGFSVLFPLLGAQREAEGRGKEPFDLQIASRFPSFLNASLFSSFAHLLLYAECNYPNCRHSKHSVALVGDARYRPPRITSLSSEHADTLVRSKRDPSPLIKSRVENEPPDNSSSSSSFCPFSRTFAYSLVQ